MLEPRWRASTLTTFRESLYLSVYLCLYLYLYLYLYLSLSISISISPSSSLSLSLSLYLSLSPALDAKAKKLTQQNKNKIPIQVYRSSMLHSSPSSVATLPIWVASSLRHFTRRSRACSSLPP